MVSRNNIPKRKEKIENYSLLIQYVCTLNGRKNHSDQGENNLNESITY